MTSHTNALPGSTLRFQRLSGPETEPIAMQPSSSIIIGRSSVCDVQLSDPMISRNHLRLECSGGDWILEDTGSRHGTEINGVRLTPNTPAPLANHDQITLGPWLFAVRMGAESDGEHRGINASTINTAADGGGQIETINPVDMQNLASERLDLIMDCAASIHTATEIEQLAESVLDVVVAGTGFSRAALARPVESFDTVDLLGCRDQDGKQGGEISISKTMLRRASRGELVRMADAPDMQQAMSIISLGITSAICCPVLVGSRVLAYIYLDTLGAPSAIQPDAAAFCHAIARLTGMAMASIERTHLEQRQAKFEADLNSARQVQQRMMPNEADTIGSITYAMRSKPGRVIAGDIFDITPIDDNRTAFFLGDVVGKGMPAAMMMGMTQSNLAAALRHNPDLAIAMAEVNKQLHARSADNEFITLLAAIYDRDNRVLEFVDAGHGYCMRRTSEGKAALIDSEGGLPLGIDPGFVYEIERVENITADERIILFSDGVVEQIGPNNEEFGVDRISEILGASADVGTDVSRLLDAVIEFARTDALSDDVTIASIKPA